MIAGEAAVVAETMLRQIQDIGQEIFEQHHCLVEIHAPAPDLRLPKVGDYYLTHY
jgi:hypothetical protein